MSDRPSGASWTGAASEPGTPSLEGTPGLGDVLVVLLSATLAGIRDRLHEDGYDEAGDLVADLVEIADDHLSRRGRLGGTAEQEGRLGGTAE